MKNKPYVYFIFFIIVLSTHKTAEAQVNTIKKPNIIFIMADDLGWGELNVYKNTFNETPNLNLLASQGKQFYQAYAAAPNCSPTRASLITGQYPARVGITDYLPEGPRTKKYLKPEEHITINEALTSLGYHTGIIGKWHLETHFKNSKGGPESHGFNEVIGSETAYIADGDYFFPYEMVNSFSNGEPNEYLTDRQNKEAVNFIARNKDNPFFLYLSYYSVHTKMEAPDSLVQKYKEKYDKKYGSGKSEEIFGTNHNAQYKDNPYLAAMLESIDLGIGSIMEALKKHGIEENTLIIFYSDNGGAGRGANNGSLRASKMWLYEGGIRVPLIMKWPKQIKAGTVEQTPVNTYDFYPTFIEAAGGKSSSKQLLDGISLIPLLKGKQLKKRNLYWHYPSETAKLQNQLASAIRVDNFKLLEFYKDNKIELYNLDQDPSESNNLANKFPQIVTKLKGLLDKWKDEVHAEAPALKQ